MDETIKLPQLEQKHGLKQKQLAAWIVPQGTLSPEGAATIFLRNEKTQIASPYTTIFPGHKLKINHHVAKIPLDVAMQRQQQRQEQPQRLAHAAKSAFPANSLSQYAHSIQGGSYFKDIRPTMPGAQGPSFSSHVIIGASAAYGGGGERLPRVFASQAISANHMPWGQYQPTSPPLSGARGIGELRGSTSPSGPSRSTTADIGRHVGQPSGGAKTISPSSTGRLYAPFLSPHQASTSKPLPSKQSPVLRTFFISPSHSTVSTTSLAITGSGVGQPGIELGNNGRLQPGASELLNPPSIPVHASMDLDRVKGNEASFQAPLPNLEGPNPLPSPSMSTSGRPGDTSAMVPEATHEGGPFTSVIQDVQSGLNGRNMKRKPAKMKFKHSNDGPLRALHPHELLSSWIPRPLPPPTPRLHHLAPLPPVPPRAHPSLSVIPPPDVESQLATSTDALRQGLRTPMYGRRASSPFVSPVQPPNQADNLLAGHSQLSPKSVPQFNASTKKEETKHGTASESSTSSISHSQNFQNLLPEAEELLPPDVQTENLDEDLLSFGSRLPSNVVFDEREVLGELPATGEALLHAAEASSAKGKSEAEIGHALPFTVSQEHPHKDTMLNTTALKPVEQALETAACVPRHHITGLEEPLAAPSSGPSDVVLVLNAILDDIIATLPERMDRFPLTDTTVQSQSTSYQLPVGTSALTSLASSPPLDKGDTLYSTSITHGAAHESRPEPRLHPSSAPTRDEVNRATTPTNFRSFVSHHKTNSRSGSTWQHYCSTNASSAAARSDDEHYDGEEEEGEGDGWGSDSGGDDKYPGSTSGLEDMQDGEVELLTVSPTGFVMTSSPPRQMTSTGGASSRNDVVVDGVRILGEKYEVQHVVGEGAYGLVMKCQVIGGGKHVAIKSFKIEDSDPDAEDVKRTSKREVAILRALQHPHVVGLIDEFYVRDRLFIVMEFVPCNLLELLEAEPGGMNREAVRLIMYQLCSVMSFIHSKNVIYRDIKPENLLVDEQGCLKLCDFGFARYQNGPGEPLTDYVATRWYRSPELLLGPPFQDDGGHVQYMYSTPIDMWAIGCLMGELLDGEPLFPGDSDLDQLYRIQQIIGPLIPAHEELFKRNPQNNGITFNFKEPMTLASRYEDKMDEHELDFMNGLLCMDPAKRLTGLQCLNHPYLVDLAGSKLDNPMAISTVARARSSDQTAGVFSNKQASFEEVSCSTSSDDEIS